MSSTRYEFPSRIADLGFTVDLPAGWTVQTLPDENPDFDNPTSMGALAIVTAPYAAIAFSFAARPAFSDGTLLDWTRYLLAENGLQPLALGRHEAGALPAWISEALQDSELGPMRNCFAFIEDGGRLINVTLAVPDAIAATMTAAWFAALSSFTLETPRGASVLAEPVVETPDPLNVPGACIVADDPERPPLPSPERPPADGLPAWWHEALRPFR